MSVQRPLSFLPERPRRRCHVEGAPAAWENGRAITLGLGAEPAPLPSPSGSEPLPRMEGRSRKGDGFPALGRAWSGSSGPRLPSRSLPGAGRAPPTPPPAGPTPGLFAASEPGYCGAGVPTCPTSGGSAPRGGEGNSTPYLPRPIMPPT